MTGVNPQMLRVYEQKGLLAPYRTQGGTRRYSGQDVDTIGEITTLLAAGLNLAGVEHVLQLRAETQRLPMRSTGSAPTRNTPREMPKDPGGDEAGDPWVSSPSSVAILVAGGSRREISVVGSINRATTAALRDYLGRCRDSDHADPGPVPWGRARPVPLHRPQC